MLARRMPSILPPMTPDESLDVTSVYSIAGLLGNEPHIVHQRPFRAPHHTSRPHRAHRRRQRSAAGRSHAGLARRALSRRDRRVSALDARGAAAAARRRHGDDCASRRHVHVSGALLARRVDEPVPVRVCAATAQPTAGATTPRSSAIAAGLSGALLDRIDLHVNVVRVPYGELSAARTVRTVGSDSQTRPLPRENGNGREVAR